MTKEKMIVFQTQYQELFNYIIHNFMEKEVFHEDADLGDIIEMLLPKYLYREQYQKCVKILQELFQWTEDSFYHEMSAFHELLLYKFVDYMANLQEDLPDFNQIYFDEKGHFLIKQAAESDENELEDDKDIYYDVSLYPDFLFTDIDFLFIDKLYNARKFGSTYLEDYLGIDINYYFELLPLDIQEHYKTKHITLIREVLAMLEYLDHRINHGNLYKLFWEKDEPVKEERIQLILENIMDAYFYNQEVEITREALLGNGKVDFKLYKANQEDEKVLIEIKRGSSSYLKRGYVKQLIDYMLSTKYKNAFYLVACFTDSEYERSLQFIRNHFYSNTIQMYINIKILDFRKRKTASVS